MQNGAGVRALRAMLSVDSKMPLEPFSRLFTERYGFHLNRETRLEILKRGYELAEPLEEKTTTQLQEAEVVHFCPASAVDPENRVGVTGWSVCELTRKVYGLSPLKTPSRSQIT